MCKDIGKPIRFEVAVPQEVLDRISVQLAVAQVGYAPQDEDPWHHGTSAAYLAELLDHWRTRYSWRAAEVQLNRLPQFQMEIEGIAIHFYHVRGSGRQGRAILLTHGWPGSVLEFADVIERLAHPERFGGQAEDGFDIVVPSLPGYGFSGRPKAPIGPRRTAHIWRRLMVEGLGYKRFFAQGGDWGAAVTNWLGSDHADAVAAIHINLLLGALPGDTAPETMEWRARLDQVRSAEAGYGHQQSTRPQTTGLALNASPLAFAAWVIEKFQRWGDTQGDIERRFDKDRLLTNIMIYLVNDAVISSTWMYYGADREPPRYATRVEVPTGVALFPGEFLPIPPRTTAERLLNIKRWTEMPSGGHFAAMEEPVAFANEVRAFFTSLPS